MSDRIEKRNSPWLKAGVVALLIVGVSSSLLLRVLAASSNRASTKIIHHLLPEGEFERRTCETVDGGELWLVASSAESSTLEMVIAHIEENSALPPMDEYPGIVVVSVDRSGQVAGYCIRGEIQGDIESRLSGNSR